ncbi:hypothetical protein M413DRAFT_30877 [Hebeloma cylindrosporum]|uniref:Uncharacterized protein n=1 Tax=Hebeloma cylindrosporum TaxID=76867 RepID=A0A0C3C154_HEBCY|nr:hypothetical protein M413DRAFT_30877 [Hebeloma cylindrosporum h7]
MSYQYKSPLLADKDQDHKKSQVTPIQKNPSGNALKLGQLVTPPGSATASTFDRSSAPKGGLEVSVPANLAQPPQQAYITPPPYHPNGYNNPYNHYYAPNNYFSNGAYGGNQGPPGIVVNAQPACIVRGDPAAGANGNIVNKNSFGVTHTVRTIIHGQPAGNVAPSQQQQGVQLNANPIFDAPVGANVDNNECFAVRAEQVTEYK